MMMDLTVGSCTKRAAQCADPEGLESMVWLAESMGSLDLEVPSKASKNVFKGSSKGSLNDFKKAFKRQLKRQCHVFFSERTR